MYTQSRSFRRDQKTKMQTGTWFVFFIKESFNDWGRAGMSHFFPALGGDGTKTVPLGDIINQSPGEMS